LPLEVPEEIKGMRVIGVITMIGKMTAIVDKAVIGSSGGDGISRSEICGRVLSPE
jgi:hypothetical protein